ncbi:MAG: hypothetical protein C4290_13865, partial [Chloroflexota bacterium]
FALRRAALGLARTLIEGGIDLDLRVWLREALEQVPESAFLHSPAGRGAGGKRCRRAGATVPPSG